MIYFNMDPISVAQPPAFTTANRKTGEYGVHSFIPNLIGSNHQQRVEGVATCNWDSRLGKGGGRGGKGVEQSRREGRNGGKAKRRGRGGGR